MTNCTKLKNMINSDKLEFIMECHDGLSAKIVEEAGFSGGWISGLSLSASQGVRDRNELSFKEVADLCYYICSRVSIPMLLDMDTGYGDFNTASVAVKMLESAGVAGVCIEDKIFPKRNSFLENSKNDLENPNIQAGKIRAMKSAVSDPDFVVVARLESFIAGAGLEDAYKRALIYQDAGADAILVHSKKSVCTDIDDFMALWNQDKENGEYRIPIVIVPTKYYTTPTDHFRNAGISLVIWANHNIRAAIKAMQDITKCIYEEESIYSAESKIVPVNEIFRIQNDKYLSELEKIYAPNYNKGLSALILAGGVFSSDGVPKASCKVLGKSLLNYQIDLFNENGVTDITPVLSSSWNLDELPDKYLFNPNNLSSKELSSINVACDSGVNLDNIIISYGDLFYKRDIIRKLIVESEDSDITLVVSDYVDSVSYSEYYNSYENVVNNVPLAHNMIIGLLRITNPHATKDISEYVDDNPNNRLKDLLNYLIISKNYSVKTIYVSSDDWMDVNSISDIYSIFNYY